MARLRRFYLIEMVLEKYVESTGGSSPMHSAYAINMDVAHGDYVIRYGHLGSSAYIINFWCGDKGPCFGIALAERRIKKSQCDPYACRTQAIMIASEKLKLDVTGSPATHKPKTGAI